MRNYIISILICMGILAVSIMLYSWVYQAVVATDWPDWLKHLILR